MKAEGRCLDLSQDFAEREQSGPAHSADRGTQITFDLTWSQKLQEDILRELQSALNEQAEKAILWSK